MFPSPKSMKLVLPSLLLMGLLAGCGLFRSSEVRQSVEKARLEGSQNGRPLGAIRSFLVERGIAHKIARFRYDVSARPLVPPAESKLWSLVQTPLAWLPTRPQIREQTAILYRDDADLAEPWWYVDAKGSRPIWVPNETAQRQLSFAVRRHVEVLRLEEFDRALDGMAKDNGQAEAETAQNRWAERFRRIHRSDFNPKSPVDLVKMRTLQGI